MRWIPKQGECPGTGKHPLNKKFHGVGTCPDCGRDVPLSMLRLDRDCVPNNLMLYPHPRPDIDPLADYEQVL